MQCLCRTVVWAALLGVVFAAPSPAELAQEHGYSAEEYTVTTDDGYLLGVFRIRNETAVIRVARDPVVVMPGLACNAAIWVLLGPGKALAYLLADRGYDVWLPNYRGTMYSRKHVSLGDGDAAFWDFSQDEIGRLDVPAVLRLVTERSGRPSVTYVGHSMGAGTLSIMASSDPRLTALVSRAYMLAPAVFMGHASQPAVYGSASAVTNLHSGWLHLFSSGELPLNSWLARWIIHRVCSSAVASPLCVLMAGMYSGHDSDQINKADLPFYFAYIPDSMSIKIVQHFTQHFGKEKDFRRFDYGLVGNMAIYGRDQAPQYNLTRSTFPVSVYYGMNDFLVNHEDVLEFANSLPIVVRPPFRIPLDQFSHVDFFLAKDVKTLLYDKLMEDIEEDEKLYSR